MDIEVLNLQANADSIDKATASINNLATAIDKIDKKTSEITKSTFDLAKSLDGATKSAAKTKESIENVGEATKPLKGVERVIDNLQNTLKVLRQQTIDASDGFAQLGDGFTRSQARALANARALGATADQLKSIADLQKQLNALTSDPFDQSVGALSQISKIRSELERTMAMTEKYGDLTQEQLRMMSRGYAEIEQRIAATGGSMNQLNKETDEFTKSFLENAHAINVSKEALKAKNKAAEEEIRSQRLLADATKAANAEMMKSWAGGIGMQSDELKQMSSYYQQLGKEAEQSARMRANAEQYVQDKLERTLFINKQLEAGFGQGAANALFNYKKQIDAMGLSADQSAVKMEEFQNAVMQNQNLRAAINPINKVKDSINQLDSATRHAARGISMQLGDIGVSLASGMNPLTVFIQQGDQIRILLEQIADKSVNTSKLLRDTVKSMAMSIVQVGQLIGSFLFEAVRASGEAIGKLTISLIDAAGNMVGLGNAGTNTAKRLVESAEAGNKFSIALLGLFKTIQALAGVALIATVSALGMLITAMIQADSQQTKLAKSIGQYGASLGIAANEARAMALASDESTSSVVNAIGAVAKAGGFTQEQLKIVTDSAVEMNRVFGVSIEDVVSQYKSLREDPVKALIELQARTGDVNNEIISKIRTMKEEGNQYQAIDLAMEEYAAANKRTTDQTVQNLGVVATLLDKMANAWRSLYKEIEQAAMGESTIQKLAAAGLRLREAEANRGKTDWFFNDYEEQYRVALQSYNLLMQRYVQENQVTAEKKKQADAANLLASAQGRINDGISKQAKFESERKARLSEIAALEKSVGYGGIEQKDIDLLRESLRKFEEDYAKSLSQGNTTTKKTDDIQKYFNRLLEGASDLALNTRQELLRLQGGYEQMTDSQKKWFDAQNDPNWNKLTERQKQEYENALKFVAQNEQKIANLKTELEIKKKIAEFNETLRGLDEDIADENAELELRNNLLWATEDQAKAIQDEYNKNVSIIALENKYLVIRNKLYAQANTLIGQNPEAREQVLQQLERDLNDLNTRYGLQLNQVYSNAAIKGQEEYVAKFKEIQGTVTDIIATALFEGGKEGSKKLKDVLKQAFRNYVINVLINPVVGNIMGSVAGAVGMGGQQTAQGTSGIIGAAQSASSLWSVFSGSTAGSLASAVGVAGKAASSLGMASAASVLGEFGAGIAAGAKLGVTGTASMAGMAGTTSAAGMWVGAAMPWVAGGLLVADLLGVFNKKPSDKTSWATINPMTGTLSDVGSMTGKKDPGQEQRDATVQLAKAIGQFANMAGITSDLVTMLGQRDGIRVTIAGQEQRTYGGIGDVEGALVRMFDDLVDEGKLDQALIDTWRRMGDEIDGTTRSSGELVSVLNLLTSGYEEMDIERANLLQTEGETLEQAYLRMLNVEKALKGVISTENEFTNSAKALAMEFERLGIAIPKSAEALGSVVSGLDLSSSNGQALYKTLMQLAPAFLQVEAAFESNYNLLLSEQELLNKNLKDLSKTFAAIGVVMPNSNQEFRNLIDAVNTTTSSGVELKAQLLSLVPAFVELQSASQNAGNSLESAFSILNTIADQQIAILRESFVETDRALAALERSVNREKQLLQDRINTATETERVMTDMFISLKEGVRSLRGEVTSTMSMQTTQARSVISGALATGMLPSPEILSGAISSLTTGLSSDVYVSKAERDKAFIMLSNDLEDLQEIAEPQLTEAEQTVVALKAQIEILDSQLEEAKTTVDAIRGVDVSVESVDRSIRNLQTAMRAEEQSRAQIAKIEEQINFARLQYEELTNVNNNIKSLEQALANFNNVVMASKTPQATSGGITLPSNWGAYGEQQRADFFNAEAITASALLSYGVPQSDIDYMRSHLNYKFYNGGYTGSGGMYEPAGIVHKGEVVWSQADVANAGGVAAVESLRLNGAMQPQVLKFDSSNIVSAIEELRTEVVMLRAETRAIVGNTSKSAKLLDRAMPDGQSILVTTTA